MKDFLATMFSFQQTEIANILGCNWRIAVYAISIYICRGLQLLLFSTPPFRTVQYFG